MQGPGMPRPPLQPSLLLRVQRDPVPIAVRYHGAKPVRPNRVFRLMDLPAMSPNFLDSLVEPAFGIEVQQRTDTPRGRFVGHEKAPTEAVVVMVEKPDGEAGSGFLLDGLAQHGGVEFDSPIQIGDRNIEPNDEIVFHEKIRLRRERLKLRFQF